MEYIVSASELFQKAKEILNSGMDRVEISLIEPDISDPDDPLPACVHFYAFKAGSPESRIDFEEIDVIESSQ